MAGPAHDALRPTTLAEFEGQEATSAELRVILGAAAARDEMPPHLLFSGPQGLGKTTLAGIVAAEMNLPLATTSGPLLEKTGDLVSVLVNLTRPTVLFIDEVHRIPKAVEETLYTAMEDGRVDIVLGEGRKARTVPMQLEPFCLIGATTRVGDLGGPFRDRFGHIAKLRPYDTATLAGIVARSARLLGTGIDADAAALVAARSRGTPRIANNLLRRVRDFTDMRGHTQVTAGLAAEALALFGVDSVGLTTADRELLELLCGQFAGGPVGLDTLAASLGEAAATVAEVNEPYLMRLGMLARTARGRVATAAAYAHLGLPVPLALAGSDPTGPAGPGPVPPAGHARVLDDGQPLLLP